MRFCGYCGNVYLMNFEEWDAHVEACERERAEYARKIREENK
jgi:hypothetical protein